MPRKPSAQRQRAHYPEAVKRLVVYQHRVLQKGSREISIDLNMTQRCVQRVLQEWQANGRVAKGRRKRTPLLDAQATTYLEGLLMQNPDLYLDELQEHLWAAHGRWLTISGISRTLHRMGYSSKKLSRVAIERNEELRTAFMLRIGQELPTRLVFADESCVNILTTFRRNGWAYKGRRARKKTNFVRGTRYSILPALSLSGFLYGHVKLGGYNGEEFKLWLEGLLEHMNPWPLPNSVLVIDNAKIHHVDGIEELCEAKGVKLIYLPPYSPDFNPIEEFFSYMKAFISRRGDEFRNIVLHGTKSEAFSFLYNTLSKPCLRDIWGWFHHSSYL